jgi:hypothetical protein
MASRSERCSQLVDFLHTVPAYLRAKENGWYLLCGDCYRAVLEREPPHQSAIREWRLRRRKGWR